MMARSITHTLYWILLFAWVLGSVQMDKNKQ